VDALVLLVQTFLILVLNRQGSGTVAVSGRMSLLRRCSDKPALKAERCNVLQLTVLRANRASGSTAEAFGVAPMLGVHQRLQAR
jgi:hypothetical protein